MEDFITIKEFAEIANITTQSIYKRLKKENNPIKQYIKKVDNQLLINKKALYEVYEVGKEKGSCQPLGQITNPVYDSLKYNNNKAKINTEQQKENNVNVITILQEQIKEQVKEIENKNNLIIELNKRLEELTSLLDQQQKLSLADKAKILSLEEAQEEKKNKLNILNIFRHLKNK